MKDVYTESLISERKLLWDEENRLRAICDNGYVSSYLYDASGERTVKLSGHNEAVFVNADTAGNIVTQTNKFTIYPDAYNVYSSNGRRTKHIYIGSERIASTVSADTTYNPIIVTWAGGGSFSSDINSKYSSFTNGVADNYSEFELPYNGSDNNNFIPAQVMSLASGVEVASANTGNDLDEYEYFYHSDHLGSTSYITDANGAVSQYVEYVPFGEVFIEERNNTWNTPYLFNAKELDEETGLYYYGARYYDPRISLWLSTDPMELKYPNVSTYCYTFNNPIKFIDYKGLSP
ncbi:MAG: hypothetical protein IJZ17_01705, partial [Muribaculaceae bacterium]|nr:hypothetical protein [Muribaculaceae bacterium]